MMRLLKLIWQNLIRNRKNLAFASIGLIVGVSTFVFFVALGEGVKTVVLERIFQIRQVEVVPRTFEFEVAKMQAAPLSPKAIERLRSIDGVVAVYPKMKFTFPALASGGKSLVGKNLRAEVIADGVPTAVVPSADHNGAFRDWDAEYTCRGEGVGEEVGCPANRRCIRGMCAKIACNPNVEARYSPCLGDSYCATDTLVCEQPIPALVNPALLEIYNASMTTAVSNSTGPALPQLTEDVLVGLTFDMRLGRSYLGKAAKGGEIFRRVQIVGFSNKATPVGFTIPISYVKRFNARFSDNPVSDDYHSVILEAESNDDVAGIVKTAKDMGYDIDARQAQAERLGLVITIVTLIFTLISLLIITVSALNIAHTFFMIIAERRREIGIMRALGANRWHVRSLILGEASLLGVLGGVLGVLTGWGVAALVDFLSARYVPDFPFKPTSFFIFESWALVAALAAAVLSCLLGAYVPSSRAANMDPARAFTTQ